MDLHHCGRRKNFENILGTPCLIPTCSELRWNATAVKAILDSNMAPKWVSSEWDRPRPSRRAKMAFLLRKKQETRISKHMAQQCSM